MRELLYYGVDFLCYPIPMEVWSLCLVAFVSWACGLVFLADEG
jgi:hypothetical protein